MKFKASHTVLASDMMILSSLAQHFPHVGFSHERQIVTVTILQFRPWHFLQQLLETLDSFLKSSQNWRMNCFLEMSFPVTLLTVLNLLLPSRKCLATQPTATDGLRNASNTTAPFGRLHPHQLCFDYRAWWHQVSFSHCCCRFVGNHASLKWDRHFSFPNFGNSQAFISSLLPSKIDSSIFLFFFTTLIFIWNSVGGLFYGSDNGTFPLFKKSGISWKSGSLKYWCKKK